MTSKFNFIDLGITYVPGMHWWCRTHAQVPFTHLMQGIPWVYFSTRSAPDQDGNFTSRVARVPIIVDGENVAFDHDQAELVLDLGPRGAFDDTGVMGGDIEEVEGQSYLFYCGWTRRVTVPYEWAIGVAKLQPNGKFERIFNGPIISNSPEEPFLHAAPTILSDGENMLLFYLSGIEWFSTSEGKMESVYRLRAGRLSDNFTVTQRRDVVRPVFPRESQTSSAIFQSGGKFYMLFSYRNSESFRSNPGENYRLGLAKSNDLSRWHREGDIVILDASGNLPEGATQMQGYPHLFSIGRKLYLLYCGDGFGASGFRLAVLDNEFDGEVLTGINLSK
jgi:hypothetical protein